MLDSPIEQDGRNWLGQAAFWARAVTAVSLLAAGAMLLFAGSNAQVIPPEAILALVLVGPAPVYFTLSFFVRRARGNICAILAILAGLHILAMTAAILLGDGISRAVYVVLMIGVTAGLGNLIISAIWARKWIRQPLLLLGHQRGFEPMNLVANPNHSTVSDLEK